MSKGKAIDLRDYAEDGKPRIDVVRLATTILEGGNRAETMVSQREIRALAYFTMDINTFCSQVALLVVLARLHGLPNPPEGMRESLEGIGEQVKQRLVAMEYLEERGDVLSIRGL